MPDANGRQVDERQTKDAATASALADRLTDCDMNGFRALIHHAAGKKLSDEVQTELAAIVGVAGRLQHSKLRIPGIATQIRLIIECLLEDTPRLTLARAERARLQFEFRREWPRVVRPFAILVEGNSIGVVFVATIVSFFLWGIFVLVVYGLYSLARQSTSFAALAQAVFFMNRQALMVMTSAAFLGAVVSIAMRWREFTEVRDVYPFARFFTVMFRPLIGVGMAVFILAVLESGVVTSSLFATGGFGIIDTNEFKAIADPGSLPGSQGSNPPAVSAPKPPGPDTIATGYKTLYLLWAIGFLAGFSERFAGGFVDRAMAAVGKAKSADKDGSG